MAEGCTCINCALERLLDDRYPDGMDVEQRIDVMKAVAQVAGFILASAGEKTFTSFFDLVAAERASRREPGAPARGMH